MPQHNDVLKKKKILFCSHEIGNQMQLMAEELRRKGYFATAATYTTEWYGYRNDINLNLQDEERKLFRHYKEIMFFLFAASNYDIFHFHFGTTLYGTRLVPHIDLPLLHALGKKIFIHYRGRDLIDMSYYDYLNSKYEGATKDMAWMKMNKKQRNSLRIFRKYSEKIFISTPDLFMNAPEAVLVPQVISLKKKI